MKPTFILLLLILGGSASPWGRAADLKPSLSKTCHFENFQKGPLAAEREHFWRRTPEFEFHDLAGSRRYSEILTLQIVACYESALITDLANCDFSMLRKNSVLIDTRKIQMFAASSEYFHWGISVEDGEKYVFPAKIRYLTSLARQIESCFTWDKVNGMSSTDFRALRDTVLVLRQYGASEAGIKMNVEDSSRPSRGKDGGGWSGLKFNGIFVRYEDGDMYYEKY